MMQKQSKSATSSIKRCYICRREKQAFDIFPYKDKKVKVCWDCCHVAPCGTIGKYEGDELICQHGFRYELKAEVVNHSFVLVYQEKERNWSDKLKQLFSFQPIHFVLYEQWNFESSNLFYSRPDNWFKYSHHIDLSNRIIPHSNIYPIQMPNKGKIK